MKKIKIFLASSNELLKDREKMEIEIYRKSKLWIDQDIFMHLEIWEDLSAVMSVSRSQDEYNKSIEECDLFVVLLHTKAGKYTLEEFFTAYGSFGKNKKLFILTFFKITDAEEDKSIESFKNKLNELGHFYSSYNDFDELWISINKELDRMLLSGFEEYNFSEPSGKVNIIDSKNVNTGNTNTGGGDFRIGDN